MNEDIYRLGATMKILQRCIAVAALYTVSGKKRPP